MGRLVASVSLSVYLDDSFIQQLCELDIHIHFLHTQPPPHTHFTHFHSKKHQHVQDHLRCCSLRRPCRPGLRPHCRRECRVWRRYLRRLPWCYHRCSPREGLPCLEDQPGLGSSACDGLRDQLRVAHRGCVHPQQWRCRQPPVLAPGLQHQGH